MLSRCTQAHTPCSQLSSCGLNHVSSHHNPLLVERRHLAVITTRLAQLCLGALAAFSSFLPHRDMTDDCVVNTSCMCVQSREQGGTKLSASETDTGVPASVSVSGRGDDVLMDETPISRHFECDPIPYRLRRTGRLWIQSRSNLSHPGGIPVRRQKPGNRVI